MAGSKTIFKLVLTNLILLRLIHGSPILDIITRGATYTRVYTVIALSLNKVDIFIITLIKVYTKPCTCAPISLQKVLKLVVFGLKINSKCV